jgi:peptide/nickel transport system substrate-binding protein
MRRIFLLSIAAAVSIALLARAERRPRYGGVLRIEIRAAVASIDSSDWPFPSLAAPPGNESPFRATVWKPGESAEFAANENYAGPRPFLDGIEVRMGRSLAQQLLDFEVGRADVIELSPPSAKQARQRGAFVVESRPSDLLALVCGSAPAALNSALALSIDRAAIHNVILQRSGEITGALLPQWLSGYAFLFPVASNVARDAARPRITGAPAVPFAYDRDDPVIRAIAERVVVNAMEAGVTLRPGEAAAARVRLLRLAVAAGDPATALSRLAAALKTPLRATGDDYETERALMEDARVIPLFHLPRVYQLSPRVKHWPGANESLADTWLTGATP